MKKLVVVLTSVLFFAMQSNIAQTTCCSKGKAEKCFAKGEWLNGVKYTPHASINKAEFMAQYEKNKTLWDKAFLFLKETNLDTIKPGKYPIDGTDVYASVTENPTKNLADAKWEFHKKYIDLQMVITGKEKMGIVPLTKTSETEPYNENKDLGFVSCAEGDYYEATPGNFFIFLPSDAHKPSIKVEGCDKDKKIVIKVKYN
jgi:YhcH/YjgK/YiaL family protein